MMTELEPPTSGIIVKQVQQKTKNKSAKDYKTIYLNKEHKRKSKTGPGKELMAIPTSFTLKSTWLNYHQP